MLANETPPLLCVDRRNLLTKSNAPALLQAICLKAMNREIGQRYKSSGELADEIERYLADEAVMAAPESFYTSCRRWLRKNPKVTSSIFSTLSVALVFSVLTAAFVENYRQKLMVKNQEIEQQNLEITEKNTKLNLQEVEILKQLNVANDTIGFVTRDLFFNVFTSHSGSRQNITLRDALDLAAPKIGERFANEPLHHASLAHVVGALYEELGEEELAIKFLERRVGAFGAISLVNTIIILSKLQIKLGSLYSQQKKFQRAEKLLFELLDLPDEDHLKGRAKYQIAKHKTHQRDYSSAEILLKEIISESASSASGKEFLLSSRLLLAQIYFLNGQFSKSELLLKKAIAQGEVKDHYLSLYAKEALIALYSQTGRYNEAQEIAFATLRQKEQSLPANHSAILVAKKDIFRLFVRIAKFSKSGNFLQQ